MKAYGLRLSKYLPLSVMKWLQWLCGHTTRHHFLADSEWGYGGGDHADVWCGICDKSLSMPLTALYFRLSADRRELIDRFRKRL